MTIDPVALRAQLEQQVTQLVPIASRLRAAAAHPPIAPADWHGPASESYDRLEEELRSRVAGSAHAVDAAVAATRTAIGQLGG
ncbi:hypothetical protein BH11ACT3_BH11ACT3_04840 [soil metagenome]